MAPAKSTTTIALFDVDGTLTAPRKVRLARVANSRGAVWHPSADAMPRCLAVLVQRATDEMLKFMQTLREVRGWERPQLLLACARSSTSTTGGPQARTPCPAQSVTVGIVGGSDLHKIAEQLGDDREC